jgi:predicted amidohydrolase YtcJ
MGTAGRRATQRELAAMQKLLERELEAGAWGMSTGLIYVPSRYADTEELITLARLVARHGGLYASHVRDEGANLLESIEEVIQIARTTHARVQVSHLKSSGRANWGKVVQACERLAEARRAGLEITADQYPYTASSTSLAATLIPDWALRGDAAAFAELAAQPDRGRALRMGIYERLRLHDDGAAIRLARYASRRDWVGQDLMAIAAKEGVSPVELVIEMQTHGGAQVINFGMTESDVRFVMKQPFVATASDASSHRPGDDQPHPRAYGTFPRKVRYALDEGLLTLEQAIRSATSLPAEILGLPERGTIRAGNYADIVVFDPATFRDLATFDNPTRLAVGVKHLLINGVAVIYNGHLTKNLAGRVLRLKSDGPASLIVKGTRVWTGDKDHPWAEAIAIRDGTFVAVGSLESVEQFKGPTIKIMDAPGALVVPGLIDAHGHLSSLGAAATDLDLRGAKSPNEVAAKVAERLSREPGDSWVVGRGWDQSLWPDMSFPTAAVLDSTAPKRPVWLTRVDGHAGWANTEAMRRAGVTRDTPNPVGGHIVRDQDGTPTGVFVDAAMGLIRSKMPPPTREEVARRILAAQKECLAVGLTCVHDAGVGSVEAEVFRDLDHRGELKLRVYAMATPGENPLAFAQTTPIPLKSGRRFQMRSIKLYMDGAMGSRGALLFESYADEPANMGLQLIDSDLLERTTEAALRHGWQVCVHAIGDRANSLVLDAYERALSKVKNARDPRLRIEHAQVVRQSDVERFRNYDIIASMQPSHVSTDKRWADLRLGIDSERVKGAYAWRWFQDSGVTLAFGSDFPVEVPNPMRGLYAAVTRQDESGTPRNGWHPEQRLTVYEALHAFTGGGAFAGFSEDQLGIIKIGARADLTILDQDLFTIKPEQILTVKTLRTIIEGEVAYEAAP